MSIDSTALARGFLYSFALGHPLFVVWLVGSAEPVSERILLSHVSSWEVLLLLGFILLPTIASAVDDYRLYVMGAGLFAIRIPVEIMGLLALVPYSSLAVAPLYASVVSVSLWLALERVALKSAAEILSLNWSPIR